FGAYSGREDGRRQRVHVDQGLGLSCNAYTTRASAALINVSRIEMRQALRTIKICRYVKIYECYPSRFWMGSSNRMHLRSHETQAWIFPLAVNRPPLYRLSNGCVGGSRQK